MDRRVTLQLDGTEIDSRWWGPPPETAPTLVLLHEGLGSVDLWRDFPADLAAATGCGVVAYSRAGYGRSGPAALPRPVTYMQDEAVGMLPALLAAMGIKRFILVGHSDGASIATIYAGSHQDFDLLGLVLIAPHFFVEEMCLDAIRAAKVSFETGDLRARLARHHDDVECAFRGWNDAWLDARFKRNFDLTADLAHIRVPILIVQGEDDPYGTIAQPRLAARETYCPVEIAMVPAARHAPHLEAGQATLPVVSAFIHHLLAAATPAL